MTSVNNNNNNIPTLGVGNPRLKINTNLLIRTPQFSDLPRYEDEAPESSRWLGCDIDKFKLYDPICSQVTDYLYMGSETIASDLSVLRQKGITHILNASMQCENFFEHHPDHPFIYRKFALRDTPIEDIGAVFSDVIAFIEQARNSGGRVFVHCQMGVSRSPCLCILWTMHSTRCTFDEASDAIKSIRPISRPNAGFQLTLLNWAIAQGIQPPNSHRGASLNNNNNDNNDLKANLTFINVCASNTIFITVINHKLYRPIAPVPQHNMIVLISALPSPKETLKASEHATSIVLSPKS
eukprot:gene7195-8358_t